MSAGMWILLGVFGGGVVLMGFQAMLARRTRAAEGQPAPSLGELGDAEGRLVWFHAPTCGPCRAMHPDVAALGDQVIEVDVSRRPDLAAGFGVMATPTTVRVQDGRITAARVGRMRREQLEDLLRA